MDFQFNEDQLMLRKTMRDFAENVVKSRSLEFDAKEDPKESIPWDMIRQASKLGLRTAFLPREVGGGGLNWLSRMIVLEELARGDAGFAFTIYCTNNCFELMVANAEKEVVDEFMGKILEDDTYLGATSTTEPDWGSDVHYLYDAPEVVSTFAERKNDEYILNGIKDWSTNAGIAKLYCISARTKRGSPISESLTAFVVPADTPGFSVGRVCNKMGNRLGSNSELILEDVHIPSWYRLGEENKGWQTREPMLGIIINGDMAIMIGLLQAIYEVTLDYARTRVQGGKPIMLHPTIGGALADMQAQIQALRLLVYENAWRIDNQQYDSKMGWLVRAYGGKIAAPIATEALEIHGGVGQERGTYIEKYVRDVHAQLHAGGGRRIALLNARPTF